MTLEEINKDYENVPETVEDQFKQIIKNVKNWINCISDGYDEIIFQTNHYPFSCDSPVTIWIRKSHLKTPFMLYSMDWGIFEIKLFDIVDYKGKEYGVTPFDHLTNYWNGDGDIDWDTADSLHHLIDNEWGAEEYVVKNPEYEEILSGSDTGTKPNHVVTDRYHLCINEYDGDVYLDIYLVARR